jgi:hypothetical protein
VKSIFQATAILSSPRRRPFAIYDSRLSRPSPSPSQLPGMGHTFSNSAFVGL